MKISSQEEYGLRILISIARNGGEHSISSISEQEGITHANVAKICRILRVAGILESSKGHSGGYHLAEKPSVLTLKKVFDALGEPFYHENYCQRFTGNGAICTHSTDCTVRSLWQVMQSGIDSVLEKLTLADMTGTEDEARSNVCGAQDASN